MRIQTTLGAAIAAILLTGAAQAAQPSLDRTVTRDLAAPAAGLGGQRFVVKTTTAQTQPWVDVIEALGTGYLGAATYGVFGSNYQDVFAFIVLIAVLVFRPSGLLGERLATRA